MNPNSGPPTQQPFVDPRAMAYQRLHQVQLDLERNYSLNFQPPTQPAAAAYPPPAYAAPQHPYPTPQGAQPFQPPPPPYPHQIPPVSYPPQSYSQPQAVPPPAGPYAQQPYGFSQPPPPPSYPQQMTYQGHAPPVASYPQQSYGQPPPPPATPATIPAAPSQQQPVSVAQPPTSTYSQYAQSAPPASSAPATPSPDLQAMYRKIQEQEREMHHQVALQLQAQPSIPQDGSAASSQAIATQLQLRYVNKQYEQELAQSSDQQTAMRPLETSGGATNEPQPRRLLPPPSKKEKEKESGGNVAKTEGNSGDESSSMPAPPAKISKLGASLAKKSSAGGSTNLAFKLPEKTKTGPKASKIVEVVFGKSREEEEEEERERQEAEERERERQKQQQKAESATIKIDADQQEVIDRFAEFVAKHGDKVEEFAKQKNAGNSQFNFLFDASCSEHTYYRQRVAILRGETSPPPAASDESPSPPAPQTRRPPPSIVPPPAPLLTAQHAGSPVLMSPMSPLPPGAWQPPFQTSPMQPPSRGFMPPPPAPREPADAFDRAIHAHKERERRERFGEKYDRPSSSIGSRRERSPSPTSSSSATTTDEPPRKRGTHLQDFLPEDLKTGLVSSSSAKAAEPQLDSSNIGHKLLSKMGWKDGEGLGSTIKGSAAPISAGPVKQDKVGLGNSRPDEIQAEDDIYEQYKKRMMTAYRYRPNPLNNPRKAYY